MTMSLCSVVTDVRTENCSCSSSCLSSFAVGSWKTLERKGEGEVRFSVGFLARRKRKMLENEEEEEEELCLKERSGNEGRK